MSRGLTKQNTARKRPRPNQGLQKDGEERASFPQLPSLPLTKTSFLLLLRAVTRENMTRVLSPAEEACPLAVPKGLKHRAAVSQGGRVDIPPCVRVCGILCSVTCLLGRWPYRAVVPSFYCRVLLCFPGQPAVSPQTTDFSVFQGLSCGFPLTSSLRIFFLFLRFSYFYCMC